MYIEYTSEIKSLFPVPLNSSRLSLENVGHFHVTFDLRYRQWCHVLLKEKFTQKGCVNDKKV